MHIDWPDFNDPGGPLTMKVVFDGERREEFVTEIRSGRKHCELMDRDDVRVDYLLDGTVLIHTVGR